MVIILPILFYIIRIISPPLYQIPFLELNDNYFSGTCKININNNPSEEWINKFEDFNHIRLFIEVKYNKLILYYTFSNSKYYDNYNILFDIILKNKESFFTIDNNSIAY